MEQREEINKVSLFTSQRLLATYLWSNKLGLSAFVLTRQDKHHGEPGGAPVGETCYKMELGELRKAFKEAWLHSGLNAIRK